MGLRREPVDLKVMPVGRAARIWMPVLENFGFPMRYRRMSEIDKATTGARWIELNRWIDRVAEAAALTHPHIKPAVLRGLAANAYGYSVTPRYPCDDRDEIFQKMLNGRSGD